MRRGTRRFSPTIVGMLLMAAVLPLGSPVAVAAASPNLVISQIYGGGGNTGAVYTHDFIEIFNRSNSAVTLNGLSLQYASATGTGNFGANSGQLTELPNVNLGAGQYFLVQEASNAAVGAPLPAPDLVDATPINMSGTAGKVAVVTGTTSLGCNGGSTLCDASQAARIIDLVGYGSANFSEGAPAPTLSNSTAGLRKQNGCLDTDNNLNDFAAGTPAARNTASPLNDCNDLAPNVSSTVPSDGATGVAVGSNIDVTFSEPVNVTGIWFTISCATSGAHSATVSGGPTTFTLDPDSDFVGLEQCTVTVVAAQVTDQDANDPPDNMSADAAFTFTTEGDVCTLPYTHTYQIQGSGTTPAISGSVTTQGVIVGDFEGPTSVGLNGFFIQDVAGDGDAATSDGLFVFTGNTDNGLAVGDVVRVTGNVGEFNRQTQVSAASTPIECGTADLPTAVDITLPQATSTELERYEGMRVRFPQALVISEYFEFEQFGEMVLAMPAAGEERLFTPTHLEEPGSPAAAARLSLNQRSQVRLNDGLANSNPTSVRHPNGAPFSLSNRFRGGDTVANAVGILGERTSSSNPFPRYRIEPTAPADYTAVNLRDPSPDTVGGSLQVAAMNMLNYFLTPDNIQEPSNSPDDPADNLCGGLANLECRGHDGNQPTELTRQRTKLIAALSGLGAEVIGLNEVENTPGVDPVGDLVAGLNALAGAGTYGHINTGVIGTDAIRVGLIYKPAFVTPLGGFEILDSSDDARFIDTLNRPVLAQTFRVNATGAVFTVAVNHLKSKNAAPACAPDSGDGQGSCSEVREAAAAALVDWLASDPTGSNDPDFLIMGDLNSYAMEDPIDAVKAGSDDTAGTGDDYINLIDRYLGDHAYSFVFDAMAGYLDHALATSSLTAQVTGATEWHINADEPDILDYDTSFKPASVDAFYEPNAFRSSDHDPVIVGLNLAPSVGKLTGDGTWADGSLNVSAQFETGAITPTGSTTLVVPDGTFVSSSYDWLLVTGTRATVQGVGTFNGDPGFGFRLTVKDGGSPGTKDRIRVEIWDAAGDVVYDSQPAAPFGSVPTTPLTSGNLTVHRLR